jgi:hypothetical protein
MSSCKYRYDFSADVPMEDVEASLVLAILGVEALHGEAQVKLSAAHYFDADECLCVIDASDAVGQDLNRLFAGYARREFGPEAFRVKRLDGVSAPAAV